MTASTAALTCFFGRFAPLSTVVHGWGAAALLPGVLSWAALCAVAEK